MTTTLNVHEAALEMELPKNTDVIDAFIKDDIPRIVTLEPDTSEVETFNFIVAKKGDAVEFPAGRANKYLGAFVHLGVGKCAWVVYPASQGA